MTPNQVTVARVAAAFAAVALFIFCGASPFAGFAGVALTIAAIALDALDGYLARSRRLATPLGAQLDILGDRVVENLFFTFFAVAGLISLWIPILFFVRGTVTDFLRSLAARSGRIGFGSSGMHRSWWARALVASRWSRAAYASLKCICFCILGLLVSLAHAPREWLAQPVHAALVSSAQVVVALTVGFCLFRAIPVFWEGRRYLAPVAQPSRTARVAEASR
ncbi:MAG TPA: CDP-alcohol phosphatidyltransferase family protein [Candidatus Acidoferrum sp.]|nr:CDP-alcohol phosphatidyltransferase family protein [Candidatus Acidoferrum sp.]